MDANHPQSRRACSLSQACLALLLLLIAIGGGCASKPALTHSGFLSDYTKLAPIDSDRARYQSPDAKQYRSFIVDPVKIQVSADALSPADQAEAARHFQRAFEGAIKEAGYGVTNAPGAGVGRVRLALTDVAASTWWKKIHPVTRAIGAGTGGAAMEAEVVDSLTGAQVAAVVQAGTGNQFRLANFTTLADVKSAIDGWARLAAKQLAANVP